MKRHIGLLMTVLLLLAFVLPTAAQEEGPPRVGLRPDAPEYALHGPYWVGTREFVIDPDSERPLPVTVWYPALGDNPTEDAHYDLGIGDLVPPELSQITGKPVLKDAAINGVEAPYPLVVISHGLGGSRFSYLTLSEHLASHGFVVMSIEHVGTAIHDMMEGMADVGSDNTIESLYYRPSDIVRAIAYTDTLTAPEGTLAGLVDTDRIAVWGHSTGGTTVFQAAGARIDLAAVATWCQGKEDDPFAAEACQFVGSEDNLAGLYDVESAELLFPALWDERVDAVVAAAPGGELHVFGDMGISQVQIPALIMQGTIDQFVLPEYNALWAYQTVASRDKRLVMIGDGEHMMFADCPPLFFDFCGFLPVWDMDRAHDLINHFTTAFLLDVLKGDEAAHAALAPDAVSFPGITYEAEGF